jgi:transcriptional regulator with XRE-family HTH domain
MAALEVPPFPAWALDSPLLRRVLASVNVPGMVAVVRAACGLSQRDLAEVAGWSPAVLSYYERGRRDAVFDVRVVLQFADRVGMPRAALLALVLADPDAAGGGDLPTLQGTAVAARSGASESRLRYWRACTDALHERERQAGGTALLRAALLLRAQASAALRGPASAELRTTVAGVVLYAGQAALDAGSLVLAKSLHDQARNLAAGAGDAVLGVQVLLAQARLGITVASQGEGREPARQALLLAREAADEGRYEPVPQLHALIAIHIAQAAALLGDKPTFDAAVTRARRELDRRHLHGGLPLPGWLRHVGSADVTAAEAAGALDLGETGRASALYRATLEIAGCPRDQALLAGELADALAASGDRAGAVAIALGQVLPVLESGVTSARCLDQLKDVATAVGNIPGALELRERMATRKRAIPAVTATVAGVSSTLATVSA